MDPSQLGLAELRKRFAESDELPPSRLVRALRADPRAGAQKLAAELAEKAARRGEELRRVARLWRLEKELAGSGYACVAGCDEVGMGPLAGPVVAAAVVLPLGVRLVGLDDSKKLSAEARERLDLAIRGCAVAVALAVVEPDEIDRLNIYWAGQAAIERAVAALGLAPDAVVVDGRRVRALTCHQVAVVGGDARVASIAAASIVAKVHRDARMRELDRAHPGYGFARHMGYSTPEHFAALDRLGPSPIHRRSFAPVRAVGAAD